MSLMDSWVVETPRPIDDGPLRRIERDLPDPAAGQIRIRVRCCGVCRTDLHLAEGDLLPRRPQVTPGHEVVGSVDARGNERGALRHRRPGRRRLARRHRRQLPILPAR